MQSTADRVVTGLVIHDVNAIAAHHGPYELCLLLGIKAPTQRCTLLPSMVRIFISNLCAPFTQKNGEPSALVVASSGYMGTQAIGTV
jgi:hypothetical protein